MKVKDLVSIINSNKKYVNELEDLTCEMFLQPKNTLLKAKHKKILQEYKEFLEQDIEF